MTRNEVFIIMYKPYFNLPIDKKINARQRRNGLNINGLYTTTAENVARGYLQPSDYSHPVINNGLYHHCGKTHSQYPSKIKRTHEFFPISTAK
jgi:hypothetical protein